MTDLSYDVRRGAHVGWYAAHCLECLVWMRLAFEEFEHRDAPMELGHSIAWFITSNWKHHSLIKRANGAAPVPISYKSLLSLRCRDLNVRNDSYLDSL